VGYYLYYLSPSGLERAAVQLYVGNRRIL